MDCGACPGLNKTLLIAATALLFFTAALQATEPPQSGEGQRVCRSDVIAHCRDLIFGQRDQIRACLKEHVAVISPGCRDFLARAEAFEARMRAHCGSSIERLCAEFRGKPDEMRACIRNNRERLTPACERFLRETGT